MIIKCVLCAFASLCLGGNPVSADPVPFVQKVMMALESSVGVSVVGLEAVTEPTQLVMVKSNRDGAMESGTRFEYDFEDVGKSCTVELTSSGNLIVQQLDMGSSTWSTTWESGTSSSTTDEYYLHLQRYWGNLVIYNENTGDRVWSTDTGFTGVDELRVTESCGLILQSATGNVRWSSSGSTNGLPSPPSVTTAPPALDDDDDKEMTVIMEKRDGRAGAIDAGTVLSYDFGNGNQCSLELTTYANLVVRGNGGLVWESDSTQENESDQYYLHLQRYYGNLVIYRDGVVSSRRIWATGTGSSGVDKLSMSDDCVLVLSSTEGDIKWTSTGKATPPASGMPSVSMTPPPSGMPSVSMTPSLSPSASLSVSPSLSHIPTTNSSAPSAASNIPTAVDAGFLANVVDGITGLPRMFFKSLFLAPLQMLLSLLSNVVDLDIDITW